jgi:hypothetical protein
MSTLHRFPLIEHVNYGYYYICVLIDRNYTRDGTAFNHCLVGPDQV